jgi:hypothetical protein
MKKNRSLLPLLVAVLGSGLCQACGEFCPNNRRESCGAPTSCGPTPDNGVETRDCYAAATVTVGETCIPTRQTRTCHDGAFSPDWPTCPSLTCSVRAAPIIECFGPGAAGCTHGTLETTLGTYQSSPYGQGPVFAAEADAMATVRPDGGSVALGAGTIYFWARSSSPLAPGETHELAHFVVFDASDVVDTNNRANILFRDGVLEATVANDVVQSSPLGADATWNHDAVLVGQWHQYALAWDAQAVRLYLDGGLVVHGSRTTGGMTASFARLYVGGRFTGDYLANSQMAGLAVWPVRLTHSEILWRYLRDVRTPTIPVSVAVSGADRSKGTRLNLTSGDTVPELNFHFIPQVSIEAGGRLVVAFPWFFGGLLVNDPPGAPTAVLPESAAGTVRCYRQPRLPQTDRCEIDVTAGSIAPGDEAVLRLTNVAIATNVSLTRADGTNLNPQFVIDRGGVNLESGALLPATTRPQMAVEAAISAPRASVLVGGSSTVEVGEPFTLRVWPEKADRAPEFGATLNLAFTGPPELSGLPATLAITTDEYGSAQISGLKFTALPAENPVLLTGSADGLALDASPIEVVETSGPRLFWGDIHGHSDISDGTVAPAEWLPFARSRAFDFAAMTDHQCFGMPWGGPLENNMVDPATWQLTRDLARQHYEPGAFVTFSAIEICADSGIDHAGEGDWNVYFSRDDIPLIAADSILGPGGFLARVGTVDPLAVMIPHYGGRTANLLAMTDAENANVPAVEIISNHTSAPDGASAWATQFLSSRPNLRLGFVGSADDHSGHPGRSMWWSRQGLVAVWADALTREGLLAAIRLRHTYAYSHGDRPILRATANHGAMMGDNVLLTTAENPTLSLSGTSSRAVTSAELYKNGALAWQTTPVSTGTSLRQFATSYTDPAMTAPSSYYWHVLFDNGTEAAWTSPIWFGR